MPATISPHRVRAPQSQPSEFALGAMSDDELVALLRRGSDRAFEALAARYQARLLRFCAGMLRSTEDAEDALQDVLMSALRALRADERQLNLRPWLYQIARNRCINDLRRARKLRFEVLDDEQPARGCSVGDTVSGRERFRELLDDVQALPGLQAAALLAREFDGHSYEQIATAMNTTVSSVKSLLFRARAGLRAASASRAARHATCCCAASSDRQRVTVDRSAGAAGPLRSWGPLQPQALSSDRSAAAA